MEEMGEESDEEVKCTWRWEYV